MYKKYILLLIPNKSAIK